MTGRIVKYMLLLFGLVVPCSLLIAQDDPQLQKTPVCEAAFTVAAHAARNCVFTVADGMRLPKIEGQFRATGGMRNSIEVWVMDDDEFVNWSNNHQVKPLYNSEKVTQGTIEVYLRHPGKYHIVFNNLFSVLTPKAVEASLVLEYRLATVGRN